MEGELSRQSNEDNRKLIEDSYPQNCRGLNFKKNYEKKGEKKRRKGSKFKLFIVPQKSYTYI